MKTQIDGATAQKSDQLVSALLEIRGDEAQGALRLPVTIQDAANGQITLRLSHPLPEFMKDSLVNLPANLYLAFAGEQEIMESPGKVAWLKASNSGLSQTLAVDLMNLPPKLQHVLHTQAVRPHTDIKELWERWDQAQDSARREEPINYHLGLTLMLAGAVLNLASPKSLMLISYLLMLLGGVVAGVKNVIPLRLRRIGQPKH